MSKKQSRRPCRNEVTVTHFLYLHGSQGAAGIWAGASYGPWHTPKRKAWSAANRTNYKKLLFVYAVEFVKSTADLLLPMCRHRLAGRWACVRARGWGCFPGDWHAGVSAATGPRRVPPAAPPGLGAPAAPTWPDEITPKEVNSFRR